MWKIGRARDVVFCVVCNAFVVVENFVSFHAEKKKLRPLFFFLK